MRYRWLAAALLLAAVQTAYAQGADRGGVSRYRWRDGQGQLHYSDSLNGEALKYGYDVVNDQGIVVRRVPRQLTAEEAAAAKQQADLAAQKQQAAAEARRADAQMLAAYPDEASYKASLQQGLDSIDQQIATTRANLQTQEQALADLLGRAGDLDRARQTVPKSLNEQISAQRNVVSAQRATLQRQQAARAKAVSESASRLQHYRDARAAATQP